MSSRSQQQGFAIALLLWMIAGMSLMVAAVIHFARADVGMAELRHSEAKVVAAARGVAMLSIREAKMMLFSKDGESQTADDNGGAGLEEVSSLKFNYQLPDGVTANVTMLPANAFVSINDAMMPELAQLFARIGGATVAEALGMAEAANEYRYIFPGFRVREELLAIGGMKKTVYDNVAPYVHPYRSGAADPNMADGALKDLLQSIADSRPNQAGFSSAQDSAGAGSFPGGLVTFESIAAEKELRARQGIGIAALNIGVVLAMGSTAEVRVWVEQGGDGSLLRVDAPKVH